MKKLIILLLVAVMCLSLAACNNGDTETPSGGENTENNGDMTTDNDNSNKKFSVDLEGYVANIGNATALGISQKQNDGVSPVMSKGGIELLSFAKLSSNEDSESKNYIVMSTTEYGANTPEADKNGLTKVTFTKTITENFTTETTGTKYITASEGQITILAVKSFTYTIYENETLLYESIQDNDEIDTNDHEGVIVLTGLVDGTEYKVDYQGIGEEITITQDEINGEIDKLYSAGGYTFISFVPEGLAGTLNGKFDYYGVDTYHKTEYVSHEMRQSFVIDNITGYIYKIDGFVVDMVCMNGIVRRNAKYYDMTVDQNGDLVFKQVVQNETVTVYRVLKDKYGQLFVYNDTFDALDAENNTLYSTNPFYFLTEEGDVIYLKPSKTYWNTEHWSPDLYEGDVPKEYEAIKKIANGMKECDISKNEIYHLIIPQGKTSGEEGSDEYCTIGKIQNGFAIITGPNLSTRVNISTLESEHTGNYRWTLTVNQALILQQGNLYYGDIWGEKSFLSGNTQNLHLLLENCSKVEPEHGGTATTIRFIQTTFTSTIYYKIILDENDVPHVVNSETYVAPEKEVITLQPINK